MKKIHKIILYSGLLASLAGLINLNSRLDSRLEKKITSLKCPPNWSYFEAYMGGDFEEPKHYIHRDGSHTYISEGFETIGKDDCGENCYCEVPASNIVTDRNGDGWPDTRIFSYGGKGWIDKYPTETPDDWNNWATYTYIIDGKTTIFFGEE